MIGLIRSEAFKIVRRRMTLIVTGLTAGLVIFVYVALLLGVTAGDAANTEDVQIEDLERLLRVDSIPAFGDDIVWQLVSIMGIILMSSSIGSEFSWRTVLTVTTWTGDRVKFVLSKLAVVAVYTAILTVLGFAACLLASTAIGVARDTLVEGITGGLLSDIALAAVTTYVAAMVYVMLAAALSMFGRSTALGISVSLAALFLEPLAGVLIDSLGESFEWLKLMLMNTNVQAVLAANGFVEGLGAAPDPDLPSAWQGVGVLLLFSLSYAVSTVVTFVRRDITE